MKSLLIGALFIFISPLLKELATSELGAKIVVGLGIIGMILVAIS